MGFLRWWPALMLATFALISAVAIAVTAPAVMRASEPPDTGGLEPAVKALPPAPARAQATSPQNEAEAEQARLVVEIQGLIDQLRPQTVACSEGTESACLNAGSRCLDLMKYLGLPAQKVTRIAAPRRRLHNPDIDHAWARLCGAKGAAPYDKSCELGNQESCKQACDLGSHQSCLTFAEQQSDPELAERYRERAGILADCERRGIFPCVLSPAQPIRIRNTVEELSVARDEAECEQSAGRPCLALARRYEDGEGVTKDLQRALELRQRACDHPPHACLDLAKMYTFGVAVPQDERRALALVAKDHGDFVKSAATCGNEPSLECLLAQMSAHVSTSPEFLARFAPKTYEAHCRRGDFRACKSVEQLYRNGAHGFAQDAAKADELAALATAATSRPGREVTATGTRSAGPPTRESR